MQVRDLVRRKRELYSDPLRNFGIVKEKMIDGVDPAPCVDLFNPITSKVSGSIVGEVYLELVLAIGQPIIWNKKIGTVFNIEIDKKGILVSIFGEWRSVQKVDILSIVPLEESLRTEWRDVCEQLDSDMNIQKIKNKFVNT